ncbi:transglycosylase domain-containing protein [Aquincola sp. S2]|uniref:peptidoglycan glycosyltransferase n=1 Tax=Pseudaquabacterium terrae TaxID=2732868 RepID=A0ABX2EAH8_9BURK|nr:transglycosylase domain-containing protein [Aquabacterium terrae]NRF65523.1 transglycosylase domain-containing protein [Aquabacterium terrae]
MDTSARDDDSPPAVPSIGSQPWPRESRWGRGAARIALWAALLLLPLAVLGALTAWWLVRTTPDAISVAERAAELPTRIVSSDGVLIDTLGDRLHAPRTLEQIAPTLKQALLATEDKRFYSHSGIDGRRLCAAAWSVLQGDLQGASTLTQQLARNLFPQQIGSQRSLLRKLREITLAFKIERAYSKDQILTLYLNQVRFPYRVTGIEMAARTYFSKSAHELELHESALLVAMLKGPKRYDPEQAPERARQRRDLVLTLMARAGVIEEATRARAAAQPLGVRVQRLDLGPTHAPHFVRLVRQQLADWADAQGTDLQIEGMTVHTTIDTRLQTIAEQALRRQAALLQAVADQEWSRPALRTGPPPGAEQAAAATGAAIEPPRLPGAFAHFWQQQPSLVAELARETPAYRAARAAGVDEALALRRGLADRAALEAAKLAKTRLEAGFVALDPKSGSVLAYVGSRDPALDQFDHVSQAQRQPGSTFKPFVYGAALLAGIPAEQTYFDTLVQIRLGDGTVWSPTDMTEATGEPLTLRAGLARSKNTITAQVMQQVGVASVVRYARLLGLERAKLDPVPSLALGTSPVTLLELSGAYGTLASLGVKRRPVLISHITDRQGQELARFVSEPQRVLTEGQALELVDILREAVDYGTGGWVRSRFGVRADLAGKTGTTQRNTDGWFIAMRPGLVAGAWIGFNDQRVTMRSNHWGQGGRNALLIVGDFLRAGGQAGWIDMRQRFPVLPRAQPLPQDTASSDPVLQAALHPLPSVPPPPPPTLPPPIQPPLSPRDAPPVMPSLPSLQQAVPPPPPQPSPAAPPPMLRWSTPRELPQPAPLPSEPSEPDSEDRPVAARV